MNALALTPQQPLPGNVSAKQITNSILMIEPVVFGFKNADQFCLVSTDQPNDIHAYLQQVDFSRVNTCYTRSAASYSQQKPQQVVATASYRFGDNQTAWADVLNQLNDQGRQGYALITPSVALKNPEGSNSIYKNLYVKNNASQDTYTYTTEDTIQIKYYQQVKCWLAVCEYP